MERVDEHRTGSGDPVGAGRRSGRHGRLRRGRRTVTVVLVLAIVGLFCLTVVGASAFIITGPLKEGRAALEAGRRALLEGRTSDAADAFDEALARFAAARDRASGAFTGPARALPVLGRSIRVLAALAEAGHRMATAGSAIATSIDDLPGGLDGLTPSGGAMPLGAMASLSVAAGSAGEEVTAAASVLRSSPSGLLPGPVADARAEALERTAELQQILGSAHDFAVSLPNFAGANGSRRYLFFAEDPAELRGTGGIWGAYAIVRAEAGRFTFSRFRPVQSLGNLPPRAVRAPNPDYRRNYAQYGAPGYWLNTNMTPDLPSAATAALATWEATGREPLDGVITADPFALRHLLTVTGAVRLENPPLVLTKANVVPLLANRAFARFPDPRRRKAVLGEAASGVVDRFLEIEGRAIPRLRALSSAIGEGHLKIFTVDPRMEGALAGADVEGALAADGGDLSAVIVNSGAGGKVDFFSRRTVRHEVTLLPAGAARATTSITIENGAPTSGQPRYVIGPHVGRAGDNIPLVAIYCTAGCDLVGAEREGKPVSLRSGSELGYRFFRDYFTIPSGERRTLTVRTEARSVWSDQGSEGTYRLTVVGQTTIRPTEVTVVIQAPPGMRFTSWSHGVAVDEDRASWTGELGDRLELELSIERLPAVLRLWRAVFGPGPR